MSNLHLPWSEIQICHFIFYRACEFSVDTCKWRMPSSNDLPISRGRNPSGPPDHTMASLVVGSSGGYLYVIADLSNANKKVCSFGTYTITYTYNLVLSSVYPDQPCYWSSRKWCMQIKTVSKYLWIWSGEDKCLHQHSSKSCLKQQYGIIVYCA